jgi:AbiTii-like protein
MSGHDGRHNVVAPIPDSHGELHLIASYLSDITVPEYRHVKGTPMVWNPYHGWQHLQGGSAKLLARISVMHMNPGVDSLEERQQKSGGGRYMISYNSEAEHALMKAMTYPLKPSLHVSESAMRGILGRVRTIVLEWALKLEKLGVVGEGMTFSAAEKAQASSVQIDTLIQGITGSQIQVNSPGARQQGMTAKQLADLRSLVELVDGALRGASTDNDDVRELRAEIATLRAQAESPKPKRSVLTASLSSVRTILEGAAGELLAAHVPQAVALITGLLSSLT